MLAKQSTLEMIRYILLGILTTLVNFIIYDIAITQFHLHWSIANTIAWLVAVLFAFITNKTIVFKHYGGNILKEIISFYSLRFVSLLIESLLLFIAIQMILMNQNLSKIIVSIVTVILNYVLCKGFIFKEEKAYEQN
ncbi:MAG: GtrA family protein [Erysipelotrichaceae bacterium]